MTLTDVFGQKLKPVGWSLTGGAFPDEVNGVQVIYNALNYFRFNPVR